MIMLNGQPLNVTEFPDKTSQVWKLPKEALTSKTAHIKWSFSHEGELILLAQLEDLLRNKRKCVITLEITYLPYGRQDKDVSNDATFALHSFAFLLNALGFDSVVIHDPHSEVALKLIRNSTAVYPDTQLRTAIKDTKAELLCFPDKGACEKYGKRWPQGSYIYGEKVREQSTGNITSYKLIGSPKGKNIMIVDDICDGGATFKLLTKDLLVAGAKEVNLFVTHGLFSKGVRPLLDSGIKRIFTEDGEAGKIQKRSL